MRFFNIDKGGPESIWLYVKNGHSATLAKDTWVAFSHSTGLRDGATVVPVTVGSNDTMVAGVVVEAIPVGEKGYICVQGAYDGALCVGGAAAAGLVPGSLLYVKTTGGNAEAVAPAAATRSAAEMSPCGLFLEPLYTAGAGAVATPFHARVMVRCL